MIDLLDPIAAACRRLRWIPGARHPVRLLRRAAIRLPRAGGSWTTIRDFDGDLVLHVNRASPMGSAIYWHGAYEPTELAIIDRLLDPDATFVDCGAHIGQFTVFAAKRVPRGRVLAIEPVPENAAVLRDNVTANRFDNVAVHERVLAERAGTATLFGPPADFAPVGFEHEPVPTLVCSPGRTEPLLQAQSTTIDALRAEVGGRFDLIKMDIEGAELRALRGAAETLGADRPILMVEVSALLLGAAGSSAAELAALLEAQRYRAFRPLPRRRPLHARAHLSPARTADRDGNWFFVPEEHVERTLARFMYRPDPLRARGERTQHRR